MPRILGAGVYCESMAQLEEAPAGTLLLHHNGSGEPVGKLSAHSRGHFLTQRGSARSLTDGVIAQKRVLVSPHAGQPHVKT